MLYLLIKAALSGVIIAIASEVARRWPGWGALIVSLPLVSVLAMIWLWRDTRDPLRLAAHADRGESLFMVGGSDADFQRVKPLLEAMGTTIYHCGKVGSGIRTKLVNNLLAIALCQLNAEALALSQRFGLDLNKTLEVLYGTTATNGQLKLNWPNKVLAGDTTPGCQRTTSRTFRPWSCTVR